MEEPWPQIGFIARPGREHQKHSRSFKLGCATIHNNKHFPGGDCLQRRQNCRTVVQLTAHLNLKEAEANHATTFCFAFFCASHSFGKLSSDSPPRYDFMRFSPATLRSAPSAQDCGRVTGSFEDHLAHEASISSW